MIELLELRSSTRYYANLSPLYQDLKHPGAGGFRATDRF